MKGQQLTNEEIKNKYFNIIKGQYHSGLIKKKKYKTLKKRDSNFSLGLLSVFSAR